MSDDAIVSIISRLGVDYSQAIMSTRQLASETAMLDKQLKMMKVTAASVGRASGAGLATQLMGDKVIYDQYGRSLSVVSLNAAEMARSTETATQAAKKHKQTVRDLNNEYSVLGSQMERRMSWFIAGSLAFGSIAAAGAAIRTITDVEMGMTQIARITEDATFNFKGMRDELLKLGQEYGNTWATVQDVSLRWAQAGYGVKDTMELTRASLLAFNTAELDASYATQGLIAIMAQWGMTAEQLLPTIDKINKVADDYAVTSQDLVDGLNRSSGAAHVLGMSLEETIAILTVMREATGRTGREVGNALNSILSFMQRDVALNAFAREGIAVWADEAQTQFRNFIDIFDEVAQRWPNMNAASQDMFVQAANQAGLYSEELAGAVGVQKEFNDLQQRDLSSAMAGIYRRNYLLALLQNWSKVQDVLNSQLDAEGYSMRENERTMQTLAKQYEALKNAAQQLAVAIGDAGLLNELKKVVDGTKNAIDAFNSIDHATRSLIINFIEVTATLKLLSVAFKMVGISGLASIMSGAATPINRAAGAARGFASALVMAQTAAIGTGRSLAALFGGPVGLAFTAATTGIVLLNNHMKQQEAQAQQNAEAAQSLTQEYNNLNDQLATTKKDADEYNTLQGELQTTMNSIADIMPQVVEQWDSQGNAIKINNNLLRENIKLAQEATRANAIKDLGDAEKKVEKLKEEQASLNKQIAEITTPQPGPITREWSLYGYDLERFPEEDSMRAKLRQISNVDLPAAEAIVNKTKTILGLIQDSGDGGGDGNKDKNNKGYIGGIGAPDKKKAADAIKEQIQSLTDAIAILDLANQRYEASLARTTNMLSVNAAEYDYLTGKIETGTATSADYARAQELVAVKTALLEQEQNQLMAASDKYRADMDALTPVLSEATRQYEAFKKAGDAEHMEQAGQVVSQLQSKIQSLSSAVAQNSAKWWENQRAVEEAAQALSTDYLNRLNDWINHYESIGRLTNEQALTYLGTIDKTKLTLQDMWRYEEDIYNRRRQALQDEMDEIQDAYNDRLKMIENEIEAEEEATERKVESKEKRIDAIEEETNAQIAAIQALIDALDIEGEQSDREEAERQHNQKLADLQDDYKYHELRTGVEHQQSMADIQRQMAEEEHDWELQKQEWARQDQRDVYQDQIDALREQAKTRQDAIREEINEIKKASDTKKKELQDYYEEVQDLMNDKSLDMLASLSTYGDEYVDKVVEIMQRIKEAIKNNDISLLPGLTDDLEDAIGDAEDSSNNRPPAGSGDGETQAPEEQKKAVATFTSGEYVNKNGTTYAQARAIANELGKSVDWDNVKKIATIGGKSFSADYIDDGKAYLNLRKVGQAFGYNVSFDSKSKVVSYFPKAHTGAYVTAGGVAELLKGERVLPPQLTVSFDRLAGVLASIPNIPDRISLMQRGAMLTSGDMERIAGNMTDRIVRTLERRAGVEIGTLFNVESAEFADRTGMEQTGREIARAVNALRTTRGGG